MEESCQTTDFLESMSLFTPLPLAFQERALQQLENLYYQPKSILLRPGETNRKMYFLRAGYMRTYFVNDSGNQIVTSISKPGDILIIPESFFSQKPGSEYLEAITDIHLQVLSWQHLQSFYADFPEANQLARILSQKYLQKAEEINKLLRLTSPVERYKQLLHLYPKVDLYISQTIIASYIGISRETLNRIRRKTIR